MASKTKAELLAENRQLRKELTQNQLKLNDALKRLARRMEELIELNEELEECMDAVERLHERYYEMRDMRLGEAMGNPN